MATKVEFVGSNVSSLRYMVVQRTCKLYGPLSGAYVDGGKGEAWVKFTKAKDAQRCAEAMGDAEEVDGVWKCEFKEGEFPELPPLKPKPDDPWAKAKRRAEEPPRGGGRGGGSEECYDYKVGRCTRGDRCRFLHVEGGLQGRNRRDRDDDDRDDDGYDDRDRSRSPRRERSRRDRSRSRERSRRDGSRSRGRSRRDRSRSLPKRDRDDSRD